MHFSALAASLLIPSSFALSLTTLLTSSKVTTEVCFTSLTTVSPKTSPTTKTITNSQLPLYTYVVATSIPTTYTTPKAVTSTSTITATSTVSTIASTITDTYSTTTTFTSVSTAYTTTTSTEIDSTTTTSTSTVISIVPTPSGFNNIDTTTGQSNAVSSKLKHRRGTVSKGSTGKKGVSPLLQPSSQFPFAVQCVVNSQVHYTETVIFVLKPTTVILPTPTSTVSTTVTSITTLTILPVDASTTTTFSTTQSSVSTSTISTATTTTVTSSASATVTSTSYAACGTNNILGPGLLSSGEYVNGGYPDDYNLGETITGDYYSAADCCAACFMTPFCLSSQFGAPNTCILYTDASETCNPGYNAITLTYGTSSFGYSMSNGPCGYQN